MTPAGARRMAATLAALAALAGLWPAGQVGLHALAALLLWGPGLRLVRRAWPSAAPLEAVGAGWVAGLAVQSMLVGVLTALDATPRAAARLAIVLAWIALVVPYLDRRARTADGDGATTGWRRRWGGWRVAAGVVVVVGGLVAWGMGTTGHVPGADEDDFDHVGAVRRAVAQRVLRPPEVLARPRGAEFPIPADPRKGTLHGFLAGVCAHADADPLDVWRVFGAHAFAAFVLLFGAFCRRFVAGAGGVAACLGLFAASWAGAGWRFAGAALYGQSLGVIFLLALVALLVEPPPARPDAHMRRRALAALLIAAGGALVHAGVAMHVLLLAATGVVAAPAFGHDRRAAWRWGALAALAVVPGVVMRLGGPANELHAHAQGVLFVTRGTFVPSPAEILRVDGLVFLGGLALVPLCALRARRSATARRIAWAAAIPMAIAWVPPLATLAWRVGGYLLLRVLLQVPAYPAVVEGVTALAGARRRRAPGRLAAAAAAALWALVFLAPTLRSLPGPRATPPDRVATLRRAARIVSALPRGTVVLSDPASAYVLSALTPQRVVAVAGQHGNPRDPWAFDRLCAVRAVLNPWLPGDSAVAACERYDVDVVVVNAVDPSRADDLLALWDPAWADWTLQRLASIAGRFRVVDSHDGVTVILHDRAGRGTSEWGAPTLPARVGVAVPERCTVPSPDGDYAITGVRMSARRLRAGESAAVAVTYRRERAAPFSLPHEVHVRFDHVDLPRRCGVPGEKILRRVRERLGAPRPRFRVDFRPLRGAVPRSIWPIGVPFTEIVPVDVPGGLRRGRYRVEVSIERSTLLPNFTLADFLCHRDHYSGVSCDTVEVVP